MVDGWDESLSICGEYLYMGQSIWSKSEWNKRPLPNMRRPPSVRYNSDIRCRRLL